MAVQKTEKRRSDSSGTEVGEPEKQRLKAATCFELHSFVADRKGEREEMQDAHIQLDDFSKMFQDLHPSM